MAKKMHTPPKSQAQARFFGAVAGGEIREKGFPPKTAKEKLKGVKISKLPEKVKKKKSSKLLLINKGQVFCMSHLPFLF